MSISVVDPISPAIERTKLVSFQPFDLGKWFILGFCAFLATLGKGGSSNSLGNLGNLSGGAGGPDMEPAKTSFIEHLPLVLAIGSAIFLVGCVIGLIITWLNSRGKFMLIDGIVNNRGAVVEPWGEYRQEGNPLFWFRVVFGVLCFLFFVLLVGVCALIALPSIQGREFGAPAIMAIAIGFPLMVLFMITVGLVDLLLNHFVAPIMYLRRIRVMAAWGEFRHQFLAGRVGTFILYVLFQIVMGMAIGILALIATCLTCCMTAVPYLGTVILLPLFVFARSYHLYFLEQVGTEWTFFTDKPAPKVSPFVNDPSHPYADPEDPTNPFTAPPAPQD